MKDRTNRVCLCRIASVVLLLAAVIRYSAATEAAPAWRNYAKELDANSTNKLYISGQRTFDWFDDCGPQLAIAIAEKG